MLLGTQSFAAGTTGYVELTNQAYSSQYIVEDAVKFVKTGGGSDTTAPAVPTGLTSPSQTKTSVELACSPASDDVGVAAYDIYKGTTLIASTQGTAYTVKGLVAGTSYTFTVRARDWAQNASAQSSPLTVSTLP